MGPFVFNRAAEDSSAPALSVLCINKNHAQYIEDSIHSVLSQKFDDFEFIIADGASTDASLEIIRKYPSIRLLEGPDPSLSAALQKLYANARGRYWMLTTSTDGYLCRDWFNLAVSTLEAQPDVSMAWGASATMSEDGRLGPVVFPQNQHATPQKKSWFEVWIDDKGLAASYLPELNYCIRAKVVQDIFQITSTHDQLREIDPVLQIHFGFNRLGYLPLFLPVTANFGRTHEGQTQHNAYNVKGRAQYDLALAAYREELLAGRAQHEFRDGQGQIIGAVPAADLRRLIRRPQSPLAAALQRAFRR